MNGRIVVTQSPLMDLDMQSMAAAIGVSVPVLRFLLCFAATIPVSFFHRVVRPRNRDSGCAELVAAVLGEEGEDRGEAPDSMIMHLIWILLQITFLLSILLYLVGEGIGRLNGDWSWEQVDWREAAGDLGDGTKLLGLGIWGWGVLCKAKTASFRPAGKILPEIEVSLSFTIIQIKEILASRLSITTSRQQMFYDGTHINNNETLESYEFENDDESDVELNLKTTNPPPSITSSRPSSTFLGDNNGGLSSDYPPHLLGEDDGLLPFPMTTTKNLRNDKDEETVSCGSNREETCKLCF
ncbi:unnamed protein product [Linum tenue]|uniref:Ubiquitin-like domain-containing protein n=1 Tax=Linum tenue TaxID=586396 RepID=A0AAV0PSC4_9ROSI|nr:unnamed protein product [Linum tenue]